MTAIYVKGLQCIISHKQVNIFLIQYILKQAQNWAPHTVIR